jgi:hypothetical protein
MLDSSWPGEILAAAGEDTGKRSPSIARAIVPSYQIGKERNTDYIVSRKRYNQKAPPL